jgi:hypothetical protein
MKNMEGELEISVSILDCHLSHVTNGIDVSDSNLHLLQEWSKYYELSESFMPCMV